MNTRSWDSLEPEEGGLPYKKPIPQHVCGLQGYNGMIDPPCPGCEACTDPSTKRMEKVAELEQQITELVIALRWIEAFAFDAPELKQRAQMALAKVKP